MQVENVWCAHLTKLDSLAEEMRAAGIHVLLAETVYDEQCADSVERRLLQVAMDTSIVSER